jgi:hypothetical protein
MIDCINSLGQGIKVQLTFTVDEARELHQLLHDIVTHNKQALPIDRHLHEVIARQLTEAGIVPRETSEAENG